MFTEELQCAGPVGFTELLQEQPPEQSREYTHRQEEPRPAGDPAFTIKRYAPAGNDSCQRRQL